MITVAWTEAQRKAQSERLRRRWADPTERAKLAPPSEVRFWRRVDQHADACWDWTGGTNRQGYGQFRAMGQTLAHRFSYALNIGPIPAGLFVLHRCDNPRCVNPDHLFLGTQADNMRDMNEKHRHWLDKVPDGQHRGQVSDREYFRLAAARTRARKRAALS